MSNNTEQKLIDLKEDIAEAKQKTAEHKGHLTALREELENTYKVSSTKEAKVQLEKMKDEVEEIETYIQKGVEEIEEKYEL